MMGGDGVQENTCSCVFGWYLLVLLMTTKQGFKESLLSGFGGDVGAKLFFELIEIVGHNDLSLFPEDGQDAVKEIVWG